MSFLASAIDSVFPEACRKGHFECGCGAVRGDLTVPASSHMLLEQPNIICHCDDCTNFVLACKNGESVMFNKATPFVHFYKLDVTIVKGRDKVKAIKLSEASRSHRFYCSDCGTPLGIDAGPNVPLMMLYPQLIKSGPIFTPNLALGLKFALPGTRDYASSTTTRQGVFSPMFAIKTILRVLLGFLFDKNKNGFFLEKDQYDGIPIGIEKIESPSTTPSSSEKKGQ